MIESDDYSRRFVGSQLILRVRRDKNATVINGRMAEHSVKLNSALVAVKLAGGEQMPASWQINPRRQPLQHQCLGYRSKPEAEPSVVHYTKMWPDWLV